MIEIYVLMFLTGLTGGLGHCIGMCGPVVVSYSVTVRNKNLSPHLLYNLGRISTYSILGGAMGFTGSFVSLTSHVLGVQRGVMIVTGLFIILLGMGIAGWLPFMKFIEIRFAVFPFIRRIMDVFSGHISTGVFYPLGIVLGLIPCGLVYTALLTAARIGMETGNHLVGLLKGAVLMLVFGFGTMPSLFMFGWMVNRLTAKTRERFYRLSAVIMIVMGLIFTLRAVV